MRVKRAHGDGNSHFQPGLLRPRLRQAADGAVNRMNTRRQARTQFAKFRIKLRKKFRVGITIPVCVPHRLVAGGADARDEFVRRERAGQFGGNEVREFNPRMRGVENFRRGAEAMQDFAEKPFAGIRPAALGEKLRADFFCERGDFGGFGDAGVVFPEPRHRGGVVRKFFLERERLPVRVHRQRRAAGRVHADADDLFWFEAARVFLRVGQRLFDGDFRALDVIGGMLAGEVRVARQNHARRAVFVVPNRRADFASVRRVHDERADGVCAVVQSNRVFC